MYRHDAKAALRTVTNQNGGGQPNEFKPSVAFWPLDKCVQTTPPL